MNLTDEELMEKYGITSDQLLICQVCGKKTTQINTAHLKTHGMTMQEYKDKYPKEKIKIASLLDREVHRKVVMERNVSVKQRQYVSEFQKGIPKTEEHKQKLCEAKANEDQEHRKKINGDNRRGKLHSEEYLKNNHQRIYGSKAGFREDLNKYFRSTWEANFARILNYLNISYEFEPKKFNMIDKNGLPFGYTPDFKIKNKYIEIKGYWHVGDKEKMQLFKKYFPNEKMHIIDKSLYLKYKNKFSHKIPTWEE